MKRARFVGLVVLAALIAATNAQAEKQDGTTQATAVQALDVVAPEKAAAAFDPTYVPYVGYGSVTVLNDGVIIVRIDGDVPASDDADWRDSIESYSLAMNPDGLSLIAAGSEYFLDRDGTELEQRGFSPPEVSKVRLGDEPEEAPRGCDRHSVLDIEGQLVLDYLRESGQGLLQVCNEAVAFTLNFVVYEQGSSGGGDNSHCEAHCTRGDCEITCPPMRHAVCYCTYLGVPVCRCELRFNVALAADAVLEGSSQEASEGFQQSQSEPND